MAVTAYRRAPAEAWPLRPTPGLAVTTYRRSPAGLAVTTYRRSPAGLAVTTYRRSPAGPATPADAGASSH